MELESVAVEKLFGRFSYKITLHRPEKITIIHAPNGFGKTVVLNMINSFFSGQFGIFFKQNFASVLFQFDNSENVCIEKEQSPDLFNKPSEQPRSRIQISLGTPNGRTETLSLSATDTTPEFARYLPFITPAGPDNWWDDNIEEFSTTQEILERYRGQFPANMRKSIELPDWLKSFTHSTECRLIETQRLLRIMQVPERHSNSWRRVTDHARPVVEMEAKDLARRIGTTLAEYANRAQTLDQSFPRRVIAALGSENTPEAADVSRRLRDVDKKRTDLISAGLLDKVGAPEILSQAELAGQQVRQIMGAYLNDMEEKFARFDELFKRASLFKEIIGEKFQFKSITISREKGFSVVGDNGEEISLLDLSSGEQHELVMLYELLFGVQDNALILIDEPELSLHVGWQVRFLPDLQRIQQLRPMQIIMATHSPQIINDRWDLTLELKG